MSDKLIFGLDIGTGSIVGTVGYRDDKGGFTVTAMASRLHTTRAVIDGQIHDIPTVAKLIKEIKVELEEKIEISLNEVCIAAAGRVLKTKKVEVENVFPSETKVTKEHVESLDLLGIEKAYEEIREDTKDEKKQFFCVGYSVVGYTLNGYDMSVIEMHKAQKIGVKLIATFLPDEVVDGLYAAVEEAELTVAALTLEPIAAMLVAIPQQFRLLNIALVDVGAGTSDISIVQDGSITAFGMMPLAGDEITEAIAKEYLLDFRTAEKIKKKTTAKKPFSVKNIMGEQLKLTAQDILAVADRATKEIAGAVAREIISLNGDKPVSAVFIVGGGAKIDSFANNLAEGMNLPKARVALRGSDVLSSVTFLQKGIKKDSTLVTPIGICLNYFENQNNFVFVQVNKNTVKLFDNKKLTVLDAALQAGFTREELFPRFGKSLVFTVDHEEKEVRGFAGEAAVITRNGKEVGLNDKIESKDNIQIIPSTKGEKGSLSVAALRQRYQIYDCRIIEDGKDLFEDDMILPGMEITTVPYPEEVKVEHQEEPEEKIKEETQEKKGQLFDEKKETSKQSADVEKQLEEDENKVCDVAKEAKVEESADDFETEDTRVYVNVNGMDVALLEKDSHTFVDIFDVYQFDLSKAGTHKLVSKCNGIPVDFLHPIYAGDKIELFWEG